MKTSDLNGCLIVPRSKSLDGPAVEIDVPARNQDELDHFNVAILGGVPQRRALVVVCVMKVDSGIIQEKFDNLHVAGLAGTAERSGPCAWGEVHVDSGGLPRAV